MKVSGISSSVVRNNFNNNLLTNRVSFEGRSGDKFVKLITSGVEIEPEAIIESIGGLQGFKKSKLEDILESFINKITKLSAENDELIAENLNKNKKIQKAKEVIYDLEDDIIGYKYSDCDLPHFRLRYAGHKDYGL